MGPIVRSYLEAGWTLTGYRLNGKAILRWGGGIRRIALYVPNPKPAAANPESEE